MIIGTLYDTTVGGTSAANGGSSSIVFYTMADAVKWADKMSVIKVTPVGNIGAITVVINTETDVQRWWYHGTEYTG